MTTLTRLAPLTLLGLCAPALGQDPLYTLSGTATGDQFGRAVESAGDIDGDGVPDLVVGAPAANTVTVHSGDTGALLLTVTGDDPADLFGFDVDGVGDLDGDGYDDFVVGAPGGSYARVFSGFDGSEMKTLVGSSGALLGWSVAGVGDVNGDGAPDVVTGAPHADTFHTGNGQATCFSGHWIATDIEPVVLHFWFGATDYLEFGVSVDGAGDVDADGYADVIVGSWMDDSAAMNAGRVHVFSGKTGGSLYSIGGSEAFEMLGYSVSGCGDLDGDGFDDFMSGTYLPSTYRGLVRLWSGADGSELTTLTLPIVSGYQYFGFSIDELGDVDDDGTPDLVLGAPMVGDPDDGDYFVGGVYVFSGADYSILASFLGDATEDKLGWSVAGLGDVDGDGRPDLAAGAGQLEGLGVGGTVSTGPGYVRVWTGGKQCVAETYCIAADNSTGSPALIGYSGSLGVEANDLVLEVSGCPTKQFGLFYYGPGAVELPLGDGYRCVGADGVGLFRLSPVAIDGSGFASYALDIANPPDAKGQIEAGSTWNFQFWYRDPGGPGGSGFNFSDALSVPFCP